MIHEPSKEAPKKATATVYYLKNLKYGYETVAISDRSDNAPGEYLVLASKEVTFEFTLTDADLTAAAIAGCEKEITKIRAESQAKIQVVQDRIQSLLSITHQAEA
jgi:hypothetical protein